MAKIENYIQFFIKHEGKVSAKKETETHEDYFLRARGKGSSKDSCVGVTAEVFRKAFPNTDIHDASYTEWLSCVKRNFWDRVSGDMIKSQSVANAIADFFVCCGYAGVKAMQSMLGVKADGVIGKETVKAINSRDPFDLWAHVQSSRYFLLQGKVNSNPEKFKKYLAGWMTRMEALDYED